jgi:hypothetical protein
MKTTTICLLLSLAKTRSAVTIAADASGSAIVDGQLRVDGAPFFPIGFYVHALDATDWSYLAASGYNTVLTYTNGNSAVYYNESGFNSTQAFLDAAEMHGIKVFLSIKDFYSERHPNSTVDFEALTTKTVNKFKAHPALLGWYINDEAKPYAVPLLTKRNALVRMLDPNHVTYSVEDSGNTAELKLFRNTSCLFGVDPYPWTNASDTVDLHTEAEELDGLAAAFKSDPEIGLCTVSQAFDWGADCGDGKHPQHCGSTMPPYEVMRAMSMLQLLKGSGGIIQYAYYGLFGYPGPLYPRRVVTTNLANLAKIGQELRYMSGSVALPAVAHTQIACNGTNVHAAVFQQNETRGVVVVVNAGATKSAIELTNGTAVVLELELPAWGIATADVGVGAGVLKCRSV